MHPGEKYLPHESSALRLQKVLSQHLGDSRVIENVHQHGRDIFRNSKANSISNTAIMANCLRSGVLEQRKVTCITAQEAAASKATGPQWSHKNYQPVVSSLKTGGKKMDASLQKMMMPQNNMANSKSSSFVFFHGFHTVAFHILGQPG